LTLWLYNLTSGQGKQFSLFRNGDIDDSSWQEDYEITNQSIPELTLLIAGNSTTGIVRYIEDYGFYEGGDGNQYRIDPNVLVAVITGRRSLEAFRSLRARVQFEQRQLEQEIQILQQGLEKCKVHDLNSLMLFMKGITVGYIQKDEEVQVISKQIEIIQTQISSKREHLAELQYNNYV